MYDNRRKLVMDILILILVIVNIALYVNGVSLSCFDCIVTFQNDRVSGIEIKDLPIHAEISIVDLFINLEYEDTCMVVFDRTGGFRNETS